MPLCPPVGRPAGIQPKPRNYAGRWDSSALRSRCGGQEDIQPSAYSMVSLRSAAALLRPHPQPTPRQWNPSHLDISDSNDGLHVYPSRPVLLSVELPEPISTGREFHRNVGVIASK